MIHRGRESIPAPLDKDRQTIYRPHMRFPVSFLLAATLLWLPGCAGTGGGGNLGLCKVQVLGVEDWNHRTGALDASFRVSGNAGSPATVWLAARVGETRHISGGGVEVGPGPFHAVVALKLTGRPRDFQVVLEVDDPTRAKPRRCDDKAKMP